MLATLLLSQGVPMMLAGDEFARTQRGNNNAYAQDNELSWVDWSLADLHREQIDFVMQLCELRRSRLWLRRDTFLKGSSRVGSAKDVELVAPRGSRDASRQTGTTPPSAASACHLGAASIARDASGYDVLALFNASDRAVDFVLPAAARLDAWRVLFDTSRPAPGSETRVLPCRATLVIEPRSVTLLEAYDNASSPGTVATQDHSAGGSDAR